MPSDLTIRQKLVLEVLTNCAAHFMALPQHLGNVPFGVGYVKGAIEHWREAAEAIADAVLGKEG